MKRFPLFLLMLVLGMGTALQAQDYEITTHGMKTTAQGIDLEVVFFNPSTVRIIKTPEGRPFIKESLSVVAHPEEVDIRVSRRGGTLRVNSERVRVDIDRASGAVSFFTANGQALLKEQGAPEFTDFDDAGEPTFVVSQAFTLGADEAIYGLGQLQNGKMSQRGQTKRLIQGNLENVVTFFQSVKGYGVFWDNYSPTVFHDDAQSTSFTSEVGDGVDYYFMYGGDADGVIARMRSLTGQVPMFPLWTYGYWQSKERYKSQHETAGVVRKYRELGVPLDGIIQDWQYWGNNYLWNAMDFLNTEFSDPKGMLDDIHGMNAHLIISIWSSFGPKTKPYRELDAKGMLFNFKTWPEAGPEFWPPMAEDYPSGVRVYDAYHPEARDIYWKYLNKGLFSRGVDGFWMDSTEPDHFHWKPEDFDTPTHLGSFRKVRNAYPLMTVGGVYDHQRAESSDKRVFILTRSGFAGQQRYGANVWSGDVASNWDMLRKQVPAGLNFSLCALPHWNSDIGGFFAGHYNKSWNDGSATKNPMFQELYVRWLQFGTFNPMMRSHGTDTPREIYFFGQKGEPVYDAIEKMIRLRYSLLPYIYSTAWEVTDKQSSFMRALVMDFAGDRKVWDMNDQFMFGRSILVAPVLEAQYTPETVVNVSEDEGWNRDEDRKAAGDAAPVDFTQPKSTSVYLPAGTAWYDFWTNEKLNGGRSVSKETTLDVLPLYVKAGSILPFGPEVQYAREKTWDNLEIRIYPGANGSFVLYEDEFDNYNYEQGKYTEIVFEWQDSSRTLTIADRLGAYPGMPEQRQFRLVLVDQGKIQEAKTVNYSGSTVAVKL